MLHKYLKKHLDKKEFLLLNLDITREKRNSNGLWITYKFYITWKCLFSESTLGHWCHINYFPLKEGIQLQFRSFTFYIIRNKLVKSDQNIWITSRRQSVCTISEGCYDGLEHMISSSFCSSPMQIPLVVVFKILSR